MDGCRLQPPSTDPASSMVDAEALISRVLDRRYRLDEVVGRGAIAFVYRATHTLIGKILAIKVIRPEHHRDPQVIARFLQEARLASAIKHPNVVDISDYGELPEGGAFFTMEYLQGQTLADRIDADGALPPEHALGLAVQIASGLEAAHEQQIVHRDLKPENVFLTRHEADLLASASSSTASARPLSVVKLLDFGIARASASKLTVAGAVLGTPEYMAPEQARGQTVDHRADLYALGVISFEMLTGLVPFRSEDTASTLYAQIHHQPPKLRTVSPNLQSLEQTEQLLSALMAKDPEERPESAREVRQLLLAAMRHDLGVEAAARVVRSTLSLGSGAVSESEPASSLPATPVAAIKEGPMDWSRTQRPQLEQARSPDPKPNHEVAASPRPRGSGPSAPSPIEPTPMAAQAKPPNVPLIMAMTAVLAGGATMGLYGLVNGFADSGPGREEAPASTPRASPAAAAPNVPAAAVRRLEPVAAPSSPATGPSSAQGSDPGDPASPGASAAAPAAPTAEPAETRDRARRRSKGTTSTRSPAHPPASGAGKAKPPNSEPDREPPGSPQASDDEHTVREPGDLKDPFGTK